jgi:hypothetical protein
MLPRDSFYKRRLKVARAAWRWWHLWSFSLEGRRLDRMFSLDRHTLIDAFVEAGASRTLSSIGCITAASSSAAQVECLVQLQHLSSSSGLP